MVLHRLVVIFFLLSGVLYACGIQEAKEKIESENDIDAARNFIRMSLDGDFEKAKYYMLQDSLNISQLDAVARINNRLPAEEKRKLKEASIIIHETKQIDSTTSIIAYSNSFRQIKDSLKVVFIDNKWLVDFKYIFSPH